MKPDEVRAWLRGVGTYSPDNWGNYKNDAGTKRFKLGRKTLRFEVKSLGGTWIRVRSGYYGQLSITPEGKIRGMAS